MYTPLGKFYGFVHTAPVVFLLLIFGTVSEQPHLNGFLSDRTWVRMDARVVFVSLIRECVCVYVFVRTQSEDTCRYVFSPTRMCVWRGEQVDVRVQSSSSFVLLSQSGTPHRPRHGS